ncbi:MAG: SDR family NAD(P)-dependent oxidoreductase [Bauldia sp.]|nr:SDR family NAD(P)-dependent oxidoreductase [Bauldia sp.]
MAGADDRAVLVTGVSSGIGLAVAGALVARGVRVIGSVRTAADAEAFVALLGPSARAVVFDLRDSAAIAAASAEARAFAPAGLRGIVNNAGIAVPGPLEHLPLADFRDQIEVNLTGMLAVTQAFLPLLSRGGRIVNVSSVAAATAMPFLGAYSASKAALEALSGSLRRELRTRGVDVVIVQPGGIRTPIWRKAGDADASALAGTPYEAPGAEFRQVALAAGESGLAAERVGAMIARIVLDARRPRTRYLITPHPVTERLMRILPTRLLDRLIATRLGIRKG